MLKLHNATLLNLVWDRYVEDSLEGMAMEKRRKGVRKRVVAEGVILKNWQDFLQVDGNKTKVFDFLTKALFVPSYQDGKQLVISDGGSISSKPPLCDPHSLSPCTREEADIHLLLHANRVALCGHFKVLIRTIEI